MTGVELLAGAAVAYLVRKARRVGGRADTEVDRVLDEGMDALHELVTAKIGDDSALKRLEAGSDTERTQRRVADAIADAAEDDEAFAARLSELVESLRSRDGGAAPGSVHNVISGGTQYGPAVQGRDFSGPITTRSEADKGKGPAPAP